MTDGMAGPFREMGDVIGDREREEQAIKDYGRWRLRTRSLTVSLFTIGGLIPAALAYYAAQEYQLDEHGYAIVYIDALAGIGAWLVMIGFGAWFSKRLVRSRTLAKLNALSKGYEIPVETLAETTDMANNLDR